MNSDKRVTFEELKSIFGDSVLSLKEFLERMAELQKEEEKIIQSYVKKKADNKSAESPT
jgi:uncharacterized small protein (DUF1192 family)